MKTRSVEVLPRVQAILETTGENIKLARLRRKLSVEQVTERAGITRPTLWKIEKGEGSVSMAAYAQVLFVMGLEKDLAELGVDDELGRKIQDTDLMVKKRAPKR